MYVPYLHPGPQPEGEANTNGEARATEWGQQRPGHTESNDTSNDTSNDDAGYAKEPRFRVCFTTPSLLSFFSDGMLPRCDA